MSLGVRVPATSIFSPLSRLPRFYTGKRLSKKLMLQSLIHVVAPKNFIQNITNTTRTLKLLYFKYQV